MHGHMNVKIEINAVTDGQLKVWQKEKAMICVDHLFLLGKRN